MKDEKEVSLYVVEGSNLATYSVRIQHGVKVAIVTFEKSGTRLRVITKYAPDWIYSFIELISSSIEEQLVKTSQPIRSSVSSAQNCNYFNSNTTVNQIANYQRPDANVQATGKYI